MTHYEFIMYVGFAYRAEVLNRILDNSLISNYNKSVETNHIVSLISKIRNKAKRIIIKEVGIVPDHECGGGL